MRYLLPSLLVLFLSCKGTDNGDRLFDITYDPLNFVLPAGQAAPQVFVVANDRMLTGFADALADAGVDAGEVDQVGGTRARVVSVSGEDYRELRRVELRVCPASERFCTVADIMFSIDDLTGRRQQVVNLNPGLRNFRDLYLADAEVRMELVFFPARITSQNIDSRLEWSVGAVGGL